MFLAFILVVAMVVAVLYWEYGGIPSLR